MKALPSFKLIHALLLVPALASLQFAVCPNVEAGFRNVPTSRWALMVHIGSAGESATKDLAKTLRAAYGFKTDQVIEIYGNDATIQRIQDAMERIFMQFRPSDELLVHISLPIVRESERVWLKPSGGVREAPWTLLDIRQIINWLNALPGGTVVITYSTCTPAEKGSSESYLFDELRYGKRSGSVEVMRICDRDAQRDALVPSDERYAELVGTVKTVLREFSTRGLQAVSTVELVKIVGDRLPGFEVQVERIPESSDRGFAFVPTPSEISVYQTAYQHVPNETLASLVAHARDERGELEQQAIAFLKAIAMDPNGLLASEQAGSMDDLRSTRWLAVQNLARLPSDGARDALASLIGDAKEPSVRRTAVTEISRLSTARPQDREAIRRALGDADAMVREAAVRATVNMQDTNTVPLLRALVLKDPESAVRISALQAVSVLGGESYRAFISDQLQQDPDPGVRRAAAVALGRLGSSSDATSILLERLERDGDDSVREAAAYAISNTVTDKDRDSAAKRLIAVVRRSSDRSDRMIRLAAIYALGNIGGAEAAWFLRIHLSDERQSQTVRIYAAEALGKLRTDVAMDALRQAAESPSPGLRRTAVSAIGAIGGKDAVGILLKRLRDEDPYVRDAAKQALDALKTPSPNILGKNLESSSPAVRLEAVQRLGKARDSAYVDALIARLGDSDNDVYQAAIDALAGYDPAEIAGAMKRAVAHKDPRVRQGAVTVLGRTRTDDVAATPPSSFIGLLERTRTDDVAATLETATQDPSGTVRAEAVRALGNYKDSKAFELVLEAIRDDDPAVRRAAVEALQPDLGKPEVERRLRALAVQDSSFEVRDSAIRALSPSPTFIRYDFVIWNKRDIAGLVEKIQAEAEKKGLRVTVSQSPRGFEAETNAVFAGEAVPFSVVQTVLRMLRDNNIRVKAVFYPWPLRSKNPKEIQIGGTDYLKENEEIPKARMEKLFTAKTEKEFMDETAEYVAFLKKIFGYR